MSASFLDRCRPLAPVILALAVRLPFDRRPFYNVDEGVIATLARIILSGGIVYRDGWCHRGPILDYIYAGIFAAFGQGNMAAVHYITTLAIAGQSFVLYRLVESLFGTKSAMPAAMFFAFFSTFGYPPYDTLAANTEIWMNGFILLAMTLLLRGMKNNALSPLFLSGFLMGLAGLTKQVAYFLYPFMVLTLVLGHLWGLRHVEMRLAAIFRSGFLILLGMLVPLGFVMYYYVLHGALTDFISLFFHYNFFYLGSFYGGGGQLFSVMSHFAGGVKETLCLLFSPCNTFIIYTLAAIAFFTSVLKRKNAGSNQHQDHVERVFFLLFWFLFSLTPLILLGRAFGHYFLQLLPMISAAAGLACVVIYRWCDVHRPLRGLFIGLIILFITVPCACFLSQFQTEEDKDILKVASYIRTNSLPQDSIFVWGWQTKLYILAERPNASRFIFCSFLTGKTPKGSSHPENQGVFGVNRMTSLWLADLKASRPKFIVDAHETYKFYQNYPLTSYPDIWGYIEKNYRMIEQIQLYRIYQRIEP